MQSPPGGGLLLNAGVELRDSAGGLELVFTRHVNGPTEFETRYDDRLKIALAHAHVVTDEDLLRAGPESLAERIVEQFAAKPVTCHIEHVRPLRTPMRGRPGEEHVTPRIVFGWDIPARGAVGAVAMNSRSGPEGAFLVQEAVVTGADLGLRMNEASLGQSRDAFIEWLERAVNAADAAIEEHRKQMHCEVIAALTPRFQSVKALHEAAATLGIPIGPRTAPERIPIQPRRITMTASPAATFGEQQWHLDDAVAEDVITTIMSFSTALERLPISAAKLLRGGRSDHPRLPVIHPQRELRGGSQRRDVSGAGKTDLLLRWQKRDAFIAECKFWPGPTGFKEAIDQLLSYTVWRDTRIALILFLRDIANTTAIIGKATTAFVEHPRFVEKLDGGGDPLRRQDFAMHAAGDQARFVRLSLLPVVITQPGQQLLEPGTPAAP